MEARGGEKPTDVTEAKVSKFVDGFLAQVDAMRPPEVVEGVLEEEAPEIAAVAGSADGGSGGSGGGAGGGGGGDDVAAAAAAANYDKEIRKLIAALEMSFNSGIANIKKTLDDVKDTPQLLPGKTPGLTSTVTSMDLKVCLTVVVGPRSGVALCTGHGYEARRGLVGPCTE